jgi:glutamate--cysteine ligase
MTVLARDTSGCLRTCADVRGYVKRVCFKTGPPGLVGTELEWLVAYADDPRRQVPLAHLQQLLDPLPPPPHGSRITYEPGGQLELSSAPAPGPSAGWRTFRADVDHVLRPLHDAGLVLLPTAIDPHRPPRRQLQHPRYAAMEAHFAALGHVVGAVMMNSTVATQVNLDIGVDDADASRRWRLLHAVGPTLSAAFANSPVHAGQVTGWKSTRQRVWQTLDPQRTRVPAGDDPAVAWADYALDADVMLLRRADGDWTVPPGRPFRDWVEEDQAPTVADLEYHLSTLFPPVRPRGWFEVRYVDAQPLDWWPVPTAVLTALVDDPEATEAALDATAGVGDGVAAGLTGGVADTWERAARAGLDDPDLAKAAAVCFDAAVASLLRRGEDPALVDVVRAYIDTYVSRGRCPADDPTPPEAR